MAYGELNLEIRGLVPHIWTLLNLKNKENHESNIHTPRGYDECLDQKTSIPLHVEAPYTYSFWWEGIVQKYKIPSSNTLKIQKMLYMFL